MFAVKLQNGSTKLISTLPKLFVDYFEFNIEDLPPIPDENHKLEVDFENKTFKIVEKIKIEKKVDNTEERLNDLEAMMIDHEYKFTLLELELL